MTRTVPQLQVLRILSPPMIVLLLLLSLPAPHVDAMAGDLDPTFGSGGRVISNFSSFAFVLDIAIQNDNKILAAGAGLSNTGIDFTLARYNADGSLDVDFGSGGVVTTDLGRNDEAFGIALQSDGKIVLAGLGGPLSEDFCIVRYNTNGSLDLGFGSGGKVFTDFFSGFDHAKSVVIQPDGKIVAGGQSSRSGADFFSLARYNTDGSLDTSFGTGGKVVTDFFGVFNVINSLTLQPDGKIVAGGTAVDSSTLPSTTNFALARYNTDGSLDAGFGTVGKVTTHGFSRAQFCNGVLIQPDGRIVAAGGALNDINGTNFALVRYNSNGIIDTSFGENGLVTTDFLNEEDYITGIALQSNGKIIVAGKAREGLTGDNFALARYDQGGILDPTFGSGGKTTTDFTGGNDTGRAIALQPDGRIVVAGDAGFQNFALSLYIGDAPESFDLCLQDESNGNLLRINSATGNYRFINCGGQTLEGTGTITIRGGLITLQHNASDRRVIAKADTAIGKGTATFQSLAEGVTFSIIDRNIANNSCACR